MPIHFRCKHCDSKLSITRRKTGVQIQCPSCYKYLVVPALPDNSRVINPVANNPTPLKKTPAKTDPNDFEFINPDLVLKPKSKELPAPPPPPVYFDEFDDENPMFDVVQLDSLGINSASIAISWQKLFKSNKTIIVVIVSFLLGFISGFLIYRATIPH